MDKDLKHKTHQINNINYNIKVNIVTGYCAKCLKVLDENSKDVVRDNEANWFCCFECKRDFWAENRRERDCGFREWINGGI